MDLYDKEYDLIERNAPINREMLSKARQVMDEALGTKKYELLINIPSIFEEKEYSVSSESKRIMNILRIYVEEMKSMNQSPFLENAHSFQDIFEKYVRTIFMLRRIEIPLDNQFVMEAVNFLQEEEISPYAVSIIIESEYYSQAAKTIKSCYFLLRNGLSVSDRLHWISCLLEQYPDTDMITEAKEIQSLTYEQ